MAYNGRMAPKDETVETSGGPPHVPPELYRTLDSLEDLVDLAPQHLGHARTVSMDDYHALSDRLRGELPRAITRAEEIAERSHTALEAARARADAVVVEAQKETERILEAAHKQAAGLVLESPEVQFANAQMRDITAQAQQSAMNARQDADAYARETLDRLEEYVQRVQHQIRSGLVALDPNRPSAPPNRRR